MKTSLAQKRSAFVLEKLQQMRIDAIAWDKFTKLANGLPAMILQNGLGHTLAFLLAKSGGDRSDRHHRAFEIIASWLKENEIVNSEEDSSVMKALSQKPQWEYLRAQEETLKLLEWVKRYAKAGIFMNS